MGFKKNKCADEAYAERLGQKVDAFCEENGIEVLYRNTYLKNGSSTYTVVRVMADKTILDQACYALVDKDGHIRLTVRLSDHDSALEFYDIITSFGEMSFTRFKREVERGFIWAKEKEDEAKKRRAEWEQEQERIRAFREDFYRKTGGRIKDNHLEGLLFLKEVFKWAGIEIEILEYTYGEKFITYYVPQLSSHYLQRAKAIINQKEKVLQLMKSGTAENTLVNLKEGKRARKFFSEYLREMLINK